MTTSSERTILEEYNGWVQEKASQKPDFTTTAFLAERDAEQAVESLAAATQIVDRAIADFERFGPPTDEGLSVVLNQIRDALNGDAEYEEVSTISSAMIARVVRA